MPGERHLQEILKRLWGEGNTGPTATRKDGYVLGLPLSGHCIRLDCAPAVVSYRKHHHDFSYVYPPSRRVALARRAALAREPRAGEQSGAAPLPNARSRRHCWISDIAPSAGALDGTFGVTPLFAESLRAARHLVRRMAMRGGWWRPGVCQREGAAAGFGGLTGGLRAARLMAGPLWWPAPDVTMRLLWRDFGAKPCRRVGPRGSYVACCVHRVCTA